MIRLVIIEDEHRIRMGLLSLFEQFTEDITIVGDAENGLEGLRLIQETEPDVVFTDITMPKMDGLTMIERVQELGLSPKIIIMTGYADFSYAQKALRLGASDYLLKPASLASIETLIQKLIPQHNDARSVNTEDAPYSELITDMINTIEQDFGCKLGLFTFVKKYNLTPEYISMLFSKETGMSFSQYLKQTRMQHAKQLLEEGNLKIYEIACRVGYPDAQYFSKIFKETFGCSAKKYAANLASSSSIGNI